MNDRKLFLFLQVSLSNLSSVLSFCDSPCIKLNMTKRMIMIENARKSVSAVPPSTQELVKEIRSSLKEKSFLKLFQMSIGSLLKTKRISTGTMVWLSFGSYTMLLYKAVFLSRNLPC